MKKITDMVRGVRGSRKGMAALLVAAGALAGGGAVVGAQAAMASKAYTLVVLTNAVPGKDAEFNDWYTNHHLHDVLKIPGFVSAQRFKAVDNPNFKPKYQYYATYNMKTDDPNAVMAELIKRNNTPLLPASDAMAADAYFVIYQSITPVVTK